MLFVVLCSFSIANTVCCCWQCNFLREPSRGINKCPVYLSVITFGMGLSRFCIIMGRFASLLTNLYTMFPLGSMALEVRASVVFVRLMKISSFLPEERTLRLNSIHLSEPIRKGTPPQNGRCARDLSLVLRRLHLETAALYVEGGEVLLLKGCCLGDQAPRRGGFDRVDVLHRRRDGFTFLDSGRNTREQSRSTMAVDTA